MLDSGDRRPPRKLGSWTEGEVLGREGRRGLPVWKEREGEDSGVLGEDLGQDLGGGEAVPEKRHTEWGRSRAGGAGVEEGLMGEFCSVELPAQVRADPETKCYQFILKGKCWVFGKESQPLGL